MRHPSARRQLRFALMAYRIGRGDMVCVAGRTVAADFGVYVCSARTTAWELFFENQSSGTSPNKSASSFIGDGRFVHVLGRGEKPRQLPNPATVGNVIAAKDSTNCANDIILRGKTVSLADGSHFNAHAVGSPQRSRREGAVLYSQCFRLRYCLSFLG